MEGAKGYSYAVLRLVPRVEREEFVNAGVILFAQEQRFLGARVQLPRERVLALAPEADLATLERHLQAVPRVCAGESEGGPIALLPLKERFHWLTAPRSTMVQISPIRTGIALDPAPVLEHLFRVLVL